MKPPVHIICSPMAMQKPQSNRSKLCSRSTRASSIQSSSRRCLSGGTVPEQTASLRRKCSSAGVYEERCQPFHRPWLRSITQRLTTPGNTPTRGSTNEVRLHTPYRRSELANVSESKTQKQSGGSTRALSATSSTQGGTQSS